MKYVESLHASDSAVTAVTIWQTGKDPHPHSVCPPFLLSPFLSSLLYFYNWITRSTELGEGRQQAGQDGRVGE
jgi:hypothetical protein